jgi:uncharacterized protein YbcI
MADTAVLTGGELNAAVTKAIVKIQAAHLGRGPANASTFHHDNVLVTLMHDVLSHAETILGQNGHHTTVSDWRAILQTELEPDFRAAVERLTGRKVLAFISGNHLDPDVAAEMFILDAPL